MSKRLNETIRLSKDEGGVAFVWRERRYSVLSVIARWRQAREWWQGEGEMRGYRVWATDGETEGVYELAWLLPTREWKLTRILD